MARGRSKDRFTSFLREARAVGGKIQKEKSFFIHFSDETTKIRIKRIPVVKWQKKWVDVTLS